VGQRLRRFIDSSRGFGRRKFQLVIGIIVGVVIAGSGCSRSNDTNPTADVLRTVPAATNEITAGEVVTWPGRPRSLDVTVKGGLTSESIESIEAEALTLGLDTAVLHQATMELVTSPLTSTSSDGFVTPVSVASLGTYEAGEIFGPVVAAALIDRKAVIGKRSARLQSLEVGDEITLVGFADPLLEVPLSIGAIVEDEQAAGAEILIAEPSAVFLGLIRPSKVIVWGETIDEAASRFVESFGDKYVRRSWTPPSIDSVLSTSEIKELFGSFRTRRRTVRSNGDIEIDPIWLAKNIVEVDLPIVGKVNCHRTLAESLGKALGELERAGISSVIDLADTRRAGGCFNSREIRATSGRSGRNLSRHSWGAAIDLNPSASPYGAEPNVDARVVDVFRRQGFAWGGTWAFPDGMHFEFIGNPRIKGLELPRGTSTTTTSTTTTSTTTTSTTTTSTTTTSTTTTSTTTTSTTTTSTSTTSTTTTSTTTPKTSTTASPTSTSTTAFTTAITTGPTTVTPVLPTSVPPGTSTASTTTQPIVGSLPLTTIAAPPVAPASNTPE
jgi:D-alanyl-D-alanine carboxypeptidase